MSSTASNSAPRPAQPAVVTGVQLMKGIGTRPARGFWAEAWSQVFKRRAAVVAMVWLGILAFFAVFAPLLANGHPIWMTWTDAQGATRGRSPLWTSLSALDLILIATVLLGAPLIIFAPRQRRAARAWGVFAGLLTAIAIFAIASTVQGRLEAWAVEDARSTMVAASDQAAQRVPPLVRRSYGGYVIGGLVAAIVVAIGAFLPIGSRRARVIVCVTAAAFALLAVGSRWTSNFQRFDSLDRVAAGEVQAIYTLVPWSPGQRFSDLDRKPPLSNFAAMRGLPADSPLHDHRYVMGTDAFGGDVLTQILHACRLSISIGVVSTGIALCIGITIGALMGYFGGWVDLLLFRLVEVIMAVPVLFLLIVAVSVLSPEFKTTYWIMAIIGCFTWTGMARYTRAEFMRLRNQDFVQAAEATGVPLRSVLFKHMLPNGVAPVLVDASFAVAAAIAIEAVLSYLGLGPTDSPSWGRLLSSAISQEGVFRWWLAVFPGAAIFLTIISYNLLGETLRDAIDPKLKKARV